MTKLTVPAAGLAAMAAMAAMALLGGCTISVDEGDYGLSRSDVRRMVCDMVDEDALEDPGRCDHQHDHDRDES